MAVVVLAPIYFLWKARTFRPNVASLRKHVRVLMVVEFICLAIFTVTWSLTRNLSLAVIPALIASIVGGFVVEETGRRPSHWKRMWAYGRMMRRRAGDE